MKSRERSVLESKQVSCLPVVRVYSHLHFSVYLKPVRSWLDEDGVTWADLAIPNREVRLAYRDIFQGWLQVGMRGSVEVEHLIRSLLSGNASELEKRLTDLLVRTLSFLDPAGRLAPSEWGPLPEKLYQGFILGLLVTLEGRYEVRSNRESGYGRADILLCPRQPGQPGAVLELKVLEEDETVDHALASALDRIRNRRYVAELEAAGASPVVELGVVFDGKRARVRKAADEVGRRRDT